MSRIENCRTIGAKLVKGQWSIMITRDGTYLYRPLAVAEPAETPRESAHSLSIALSTPKVSKVDNKPRKTANASSVSMSGAGCVKVGSFDVESGSGLLVGCL